MTETTHLEKHGRPNGELRYAASGYRDVGCTSRSGTIHFGFVIENYHEIPKDNSFDKMVSERTEELAWEKRGSQYSDIPSENPCTDCGPWDFGSKWSRCTAADYASYQLGATVLHGYMEQRPYMLIFDRFTDTNPHVGYWNITEADWEKWKLEKGERDIMSLRGNVQKTDGLSAHDPKMTYKPTKMPQNGREISETKWFTIVDGGDFKPRTTWSCCSRHSRAAHTIRIKRIDGPQLRNQQIGSTIMYRRSRDFWFPIFAASGHSGFGRFVGMLSSESMGDELLDFYLKRVITSDWSSFNEY
jgi:hypothetical protein